MFKVYSYCVSHGQSCAASACIYREEFNDVLIKRQIVLKTTLSFLSTMIIKNVHYLTNFITFIYEHIEYRICFKSNCNILFKIL